MGQHILVPRYEHSDLSPDFLDNIRMTDGDEAELAYIKENSMPQGSCCIWLRDAAQGATSCAAYSRRSKTCRDYNSDGSCRVMLQRFGFM